MKHTLKLIAIVVQEDCVRFTEKLKGAEKVAMQVLQVVMTFDCKENTCNEKKNTHNYVMYIRKYWVGRIHCLPTQCHDWVGSLGGRLPNLPHRFPRPW